jgi:hypothetical protein
MKVLFTVQIAHHMRRALPRVQFETPEEAEKGNAVFISLSRKPGGCLFTPANFASHDDHTPPFLHDGSAPPSSSDPKSTLKGWMDRIVADLSAQFNVTSVEVTEEEFHGSGEDDGDDAPPNGNPVGGIDWKAHGVN